MCFTPATAPAASVSPDMIEASSSTVPSLVKTAPRPALKSGESSSNGIAVVTASRAEPPFWITSYPARRASSSAAR